MTTTGAEPSRQRGDTVTTGPVRRRERRRLGLRRARGPRPEDLVTPRDVEAVEVEAVARRFVDAVVGGRVAEIVSSYASDAAVHLPDGRLIDGRDLEAWWSNSILRSVAATLTSLGGHEFSTEWVLEDATTMAAHSTVIDGLIVEQDLVDVSRVEMVVGSPLEISSSGEVTNRHRNHAREVIWRLVDSRHLDATDIRIRLEQSPDPAHERPATARASLVVHGDPIRAAATASTVDEAIDRLDDRLRHRLDHVARHRRALRRRGAGHEPGEWRHGDWSPASGPWRHTNPTVVHRHTWTPDGDDLDEAIWDLEAMDWEFVLFRDPHGEDMVISRLEDHGYRMRTRSGREIERGHTEAGARIEVDARPFPVLELDQARDRLVLEELGWLPFVDASSGLSGVLYRRRDGHDGVITVGDSP